ncbi:MAG TPA: hypothetical protein VFI32_08435 [Rhodanobacteraceae bacterium]|nr:hypothetical protein [Rhodanobacteraceae bacterium]
MSVIEAVIASTALDSQGERLTPEAIRQLSESVNSRLIPIGTEHDPRIPPQGRLRSCFVRERSDGELEAVAEMEFFEPGQEPLSGGERAIPIHSAIDEKLVVSYDWTHRDQSDRNDIDAIALLLGTRPAYEAKKSADPISIISLTGVFALGGIASGLFNKIGSDIWDSLKPRLSRLISKTETRKGEQLVIFRTLVEIEGSTREVETILTNPTTEQVELFIRQGASALDKVLPVYAQGAPELKRLVFEYKDGELLVRFGVLTDCRPVTPTLSVRDIIDRGPAP